MHRHTRVGGRNANAASIVAMAALDDLVGHLGWQARCKKEQSAYANVLVADYSQRGKALGFDVWDHESVAPCHDLFRTMQPMHSVSLPALRPELEADRSSMFWNKKRNYWDNRNQPVGCSPAAAARVPQMAQTASVGFPQMAQTAGAGFARPRTVAGRSVISRQRGHDGVGGSSIFTSSSMRSEVVDRVVKDEVARAMTAPWPIAEVPKSGSREARPRRQFASRRDRLQAMLVEAKPPNLRPPAEPWRRVGLQTR